jgi:hypothetical protein
MSAWPYRLPSEDRRWFVLWCAAPKLPEAQAVSLWNWYQHRGGFEAVAHYLHTRDVSAWNPNAAAPYDRGQGHHGRARHEHRRVIPSRPATPPRR